MTLLERVIQTLNPILVLQVILLLTALAGSSYAQPTLYSATPIAAPAGGRQVYAAALNDNGQVSGTFYASIQQAFVYDSNTNNLVNLGALVPGFSEAIGLNNKGQVIGDGGTSGHALLFNNALGAPTVTDLGTLGGSYSTGFAINNAGQAVGSSTLPGNTSNHAFLYANGALKDLGTFGGPNSTAYSINQLGQIAGTAYLPLPSPSTQVPTTHAFLDTNGVLNDLGTLGGTSSVARVVNDLGQVAGTANIASGANHAFLYTNGVMVDLGTAGNAASYSLGLNNNGQVVGYLEQVSSGYPFPPPVDTAFLYTAGVLYNLNSLVTNLPAGVTLSEANAINNAGQIVAISQGGSFLLTPVPEPAAILLSALGLLAATAFRPLRTRSNIQ